jgi:hypothetical protein
MLWLCVAKRGAADRHFRNDRAKQLPELPRIGIFARLSRWVFPPLIEMKTTDLPIEEVA